MPISIQQKILALLLGLALPALVLAGWLGLLALDRARETAVETGATALRSQAEQMLLTRAADKARFYDLALNAIEQQVGAVANYATTRYTTGPFTPNAERVWVAPAPTPALLARHVQDVAFAQQIIRTLRSSVEANGLVSIGYVALEASGVIAFDDDAVIDALLQIQPFDPRVRPWYLAAREAGTIVWTDAYVDANTGLLTTTCAQPIYDSQGNFIGVVAFDLLLQTIQQDLLALDVGEQGYAMLINHRGEVIVRPDMDAGDWPWNRPFRSENLLESSSADLRTVAAAMVNPAHGHGLALLSNQEQPAYIAYAPIPTAGWSVALVIPEEEVTAPAELTSQLIVQRQKLLRNQLIGLIFVLATIISIFGIFLSFSFTRRINVVREGVQALARGKLDDPIPPVGNDELGELAVAFNRMALKLAEKIAKLEENAQQLAALNAVSNELKGILALHQLLEAIPAAICERFAFDRAVVYLVEDDQLRVVAAWFGAEGTPQAQQFMEVANSHPLSLTGSTIEADVIRNGKAVIVDNPWVHPGVEQHKQAISASDIYIQVPIFGREGRALGLLSADCQLSRRRIGVEDAARLLTFAGMVGLTIQNVQLFSDLERQVAQRTEELRAALEVAQLADRRKSAFLASLSHELRTPLNAIIGFSTVMLDEIDGPLSPPQYEDLTSINRNGRFLLGMIDELLDLARIEAGHMHLDIAPTDLAAVVGDAVDAAQGLLHGNNITMYHNLPADLPLVSADGKRVRQILLNLLSNAVKFTERGSIRVTATVLDELNDADELEAMVVVRVSDTGIGIPTDRLNDVFQEFVQIHGLRSRSAGTGLGLAISRKLVEAQQGRIWVESAPSRGSTFSFSLPLATPVAVTTLRPLMLE
ncbi:MAG: HAMP domain-containing protein [Candidatus Viridilinea halotolerans]|uniref:Circadian input-output histidine kinase CikA n=1 Tax=Candidatus Viridilinea halotolerans TaxID=2491704 RepID=A0A426U0X8_9CHLR|nr:MAG: HAMP domain-containing protein [Candidatus Viridilinea halotolerans]